MCDGLFGRDINVTRSKLGKLERAIFSTRTNTENAITLKTCTEVYFLRELLSGLLVQNIGRVVTDVTKVSHLAQSFFSTCHLILEGCP